jgi:tetratricopeptide (TPR) repeat protein
MSRIFRGCLFVALAVMTMPFVRAEPVAAASLCAELQSPAAVSQPLDSGNAAFEAGHSTKAAIRLCSAHDIATSQVRLRRYMAQMEQIAAKEGPVSRTTNDSDPFSRAVYRSEDLAEDRKYAEAAEILSALINGQVADDWKQMLQTRIHILKKWRKSGRIELSEYRTFFLETGPEWFHNRTRPITALWKRKTGPEVERYFLIGALLGARHDSEGQVIVLSAIPDLDGVTNEAAANALLAVGNLLSGSRDLSGAESNWSRVMSRYVGTRAWPEAVFNLGILYKEEKKRYVEAIAFFERLLDSESNDTHAYRGYSHASALALSQCYEALNNYTNALKWAREAQTRYPDDSWCGTGLQEEQQRNEQRIRELEKKRAE